MERNRGSVDRKETNDLPTKSHAPEHQKYRYALSTSSNRIAGPKMAPVVSTGNFIVFSIFTMMLGDESSSNYYKNVKIK